MDDLALHPQTRSHIERFLRYPNHGLLLLGPEGSGKFALTATIVRQRLGLDHDADILTQPYLKLIEPEKDKLSIGIEAIRELQHFAALKVPGTPSAANQRFVIIPKAQRLTGEAQNALLKLLEEPPAGTSFILTADSEQLLLPTIRSRVQLLTVHQPGRNELIRHFDNRGSDAKDVQQAYFMSGGLPGLMHALLNDAEHPMKQAAQTARQVLQADQFKRLCMVDELSKKRPEALQVLAVLRHMAQAAIEQSAQANSDQLATTKRIKQWHKVLQASYEAEKAYAVSAQAKLNLTNLMLAF